MIREETIDFDAELDRLNSRLEELASQHAAASGDRAAMVVQEAQEVETHRDGVLWARDHAADDPAVPFWGDGESITIAGLTAGEMARIEDAAADDGQGAMRVQLAAAGTVDAPFLDADTDDETAIARCGQLPDPFLRWLASRINDKTSLGDSGNGQPSFADLIVEQS